MANSERGELTFVAGDQIYTLKLTTNSMCALEDALSTDQKRVTFQEALERMNTTNSMRDIRAIIWAALIEKHPEMTIKRAGEVIDAAGGIVKFADMLGKMVGSTTPDDQDLKALGVAQARPPRRAKRDGVGTGAN